MPNADTNNANKFPPNSFTIPAVISKVKAPNKQGQNLIQKKEPPNNEEIHPMTPISGGFSKNPRLRCCPC